jgi:hypothetical protein
MITDRTGQSQHAATTRHHHSTRRYILRRRRSALAVSVQRPAQDVRAQVVRAFRTLANGVGQTTAQQQAVSFYQSSGQIWARRLGDAGPQVSRADVVAAFVAMAHGRDASAAGEATLRFYRASGHSWTRGLGAAA